MYQGKYVFSQVMNSVSRFEFNRCVERYKGGHGVKNFSCWEQFLAMAFGQLALRRSLRDVVIGLTAMNHKLYHLGFRCAVTRSNLHRSLHLLAAGCFKKGAGAEKKSLRNSTNIKPMPFQQNTLT